MPYWSYGAVTSLPLPAFHKLSKTSKSHVSECILMPRRHLSRVQWKSRNRIKVQGFSSPIYPSFRVPRKIIRTLGEISEKGEEIKSYSKFPTLDFHRGMAFVAVSRSIDRRLHFVNCPPDSLLSWKERKEFCTHLGSNFVTRSDRIKWHECSSVVLQLRNPKLDSSASSSISISLIGTIHFPGHTRSLVGNRGILHPKYSAGCVPRWKLQLNCSETKSIR